MIDYLNYFRIVFDFADLLSRLLPLAMAMLFAYAASMNASDAKYWRDVAKNEVKHAFWLECALDAWYFRRPRPKLEKAPRNLAIEEAQAIVNEIYKDEDKRVWN